MVGVLRVRGGMGEQSPEVRTLRTESKGLSKPITNVQLSPTGGREAPRAGHTLNHLLPTAEPLLPWKILTHGRVLDLHDPSAACALSSAFVVFLLTHQSSLLIAQSCLCPRRPLGDTLPTTNHDSRRLSVMQLYYLHPHPRTPADLILTSWLKHHLRLVR